MQNSSNNLQFQTIIIAQMLPAGRVGAATNIEMFRTLYVKVCGHLTLSF